MTNLTAATFDTNCLVALDLIAAFDTGDIARVAAYVNASDRSQLRTLSLTLFGIAGHLGAEQLADIRELSEHA